ncbi:DUF1361 domain-containing protein [Cohnella algarum]|uniref:DUF1361 domain-containing protein n=1 Tax=Cohnella algarum TaxID=2044859 RepID=UPI001967DCC9|nr:DUF1361 domain-containing protein [Cohnella algarum]MBN2984482.1 DUF1361 domain-containing protein [Cohnella algarum]
MSRQTRHASIGGALGTPILLVLTGTSFLCLLLLIVRANQLELDFIKHRFLLWNLFLAWIPLFVSMATMSLERRRRSGKPGFAFFLLAIVWLLFYPNAPYLTTDLIHLIADPNYIWSKINESLLVWYDLVIFFIFSWAGLLLGYLSMRQFHHIIRHYGGPVAGWAFIFATSFLGGFGVYLGRVVRLNSWDVLFSPFRLIEGVLGGLDHRGAIFTLLFGMLILIVYLSLYGLGSLTMQTPKSARPDPEPAGGNEP